MNKDTMARGIQIEGHKLMYHVNEVARWLKGELIAPIYVEVGPINSCNHKCSFCALDYLKSKGALIDKDILIQTLKDMADFGVKSVMFAGEGEPLLYKPLPEVIQKAKGFGLDTAITTNGVLLTEEKAKSILKNLTWIKFSIDAGTKKTYGQIHGCKEEDFEKVINNLRFACGYKNKNNLDCSIGCQVLLIPENINEVEQLILKVKDVGADYIVLKPYSQHPNSINRLDLNIDNYDKILLELSENYSNENFKVIYRKASVLEIEKRIGYNKCYGLNFFCLIDALGNVIPCNIFYEKEDYYYGNLYKNSFRDLWASDKRQKVLERLYKKGCSDCRKGCRLNFINKYLDTVKNRNIEHINFI